ncbi:ABC transporter permease [Ruminococcaceae bacterium OttesenSCG-928-D13]|nr:ABC transporter permease [Ruminococcaceae bacterium OttesenSCG-928-D13]
MPKLLILILEAIYLIPGVQLEFDIVSGGLGVLLFVVSNLAATALACRSELRRSPASLMRPKAPRAGSRILLERVPAIWNRLKFLNKVTARNLFRYKRRLFMTVIGIAGCTALVLAGFAIRDSVTDLMPKQYEYIYQYDLLVAADGDDNPELLELLDGDEGVESYLSIQMDSIKLFNAGGASESMQMVVVPAGANLADYVNTPDADGNTIPPNDDGILVTQNTATMLDLSPGDVVALQNLVLDRYDLAISAVVENYLGNTVFITQQLYESLFGPMEPNAAYVHLSDTVADQPAFAEALLDENDIVLTSLSTEVLATEFTTDFAILNYVIYILTVLAAALAFVVLFTLANTNISERIRELATIKVLGFFDSEVHSYANKETLILTLIGVVCGLPLGYLVSGLLLGVLKMPSIQFVLVIEPLSYLIAGVISFSFALVVNLITNRILDKINMVEALKSVE